MRSSAVRTTLAVLTLAAGGAGAALVGAAPAAASGYKMSQGAAQSRLSANGISWYSSGNCSARNNPSCTSFDQINSGTIDGVVTLRGASGCQIVITGGTETGHASGTYSHWNGYKVDIRTSTTTTTCIDRYIRANFAFIGNRGDGAPQYRSGSGNIYANEGTHWDVLYY
jgi:hypothetical protein